MWSHFGALLCHKLDSTFFDIFDSKKEENQFIYFDFFKHEMNLLNKWLQTRLSGIFLWSVQRADSNKDTTTQQLW